MTELRYGLDQLWAARRLAMLSRIAQCLPARNAIRSNIESNSIRSLSLMEAIEVKSGTALAGPDAPGNDQTAPRLRPGCHAEASDSLLGN